jgi:hypothetical protein
MDFFKSYPILTTIDAEGYCIFWDLRKYKMFNYYDPLLKILLYDPKVDIILTTRMIIDTFDRDIILDQSADINNNSSYKFTSRFYRSNIKKAFRGSQTERSKPDKQCNLDEKVTLLYFSDNKGDVR